LEEDDDECCAFSTQSHALIAKGETDTWYTDTRASEHMTDRKEWFTNIIDMPEGRHSVMVTDDRCLAV
jgi:hypothetical protein